MADSKETIKANMTAPTHRVVDGVKVDLTAEEAEAILDEWVDNEHARQVDEEANGYKKSRKDSYLSIGDQLDMQYWDKVNGTTNWEDHIAKVKSDNPKASE